MAERADGAREGREEDLRRLDGVASRSLSEDDIGDVSAIAARLQAVLGYPVAYDRALVLEAVSASKEAWVLAEAGRVLAFVRAYERDGVAEVVAFLDPQARCRGLGTRLVDDAELWARANGYPAVRLHAYERDVKGAALLQRRGYLRVRSFYEMSLTLRAQGDPPRAPRGIRISSFRREDARRFFDTTVAAFSVDPGFVTPTFDRWSSDKVDDGDTSSWLLAWEGDEVLGALQANILEHQRARIQTVGVLADHRRRGIGRALLEHSFSMMRDRGVCQVGLGVNAQNATGAVQLYRDLGMTPASETLVFERHLDSLSSAAL